MKTIELKSAQLDYWAGKAAGRPMVMSNDGEGPAYDDRRHSAAYEPSTDWRECGEMYDWFKPSIWWNEPRQQFEANLPGYEGFWPGETAPIAFCRALVASVYGDEVPDDVVTA